MTGVLRSGVTDTKTASSPNDEPAADKFRMVRMRGLEPPRCHHHRLLRPARLPVPPHPQGTGCHYANGFRRCQPRKSCVREGALPGGLVSAVPAIVVPPVIVPAIV